MVDPRIGEPKEKFREGLADYLAEAMQVTLTAEQLDYILDRMYPRYSFMKFSEIVAVYRLDLLNAELRAYVHYARKAQP